VNLGLVGAFQFALQFNLNSEKKLFGKVGVKEITRFEKGIRIIHGKFTQAQWTL
jgi:hypothetical protein